jgi:N utilization substance protein A
MNGDFIEALEQLQKEKDIPMAALLHTVETAMSSAYRRHYGTSEDVRLIVDPQHRQVKMIVRKPILPPVVEGEEQPTLEELDEAGLLQYEEREIDTAEFGRIAAQTAKQVVTQKIREAEREIVLDEFSHRVGEVITGEVARKDARNVYVTLGRVEAVLPSHEQIPGEPYRFNDRLKVYILDVRKTTKAPQILLSRTHPALVTRLFELEVPEVYDGIVEIKSVAREPGARSKVAVLSRDPQIDAVGACVGHRGARVQAIVDELRDEKIDIVRYNDDIREYLKSALSPAKVSLVLPNPEDQSATVVAPDNQLSLAIGRRGQNVRLAAQLTGWRIDIRSESQWAEQPEAAAAAAAVVTAVAPVAAAPVPAAEALTTEAGDKRFRIYELAKELEVESRDLVEILQEEGIEVTSHASTVSEEVAQMLRDLLMGGEGTLDDMGGEDEL